MKIGIIGLGLMGGSIIKALKKQRSSCFIATFAYGDQEEAVQSGLIDQVYQTLEGLMEGVDLLILASPLATLIPYVEQIAASRGCLTHPLLVIDIASVKRDLLEKLEALSSSEIEFLSTHPMAGSEKKGFAHSRSDLFFHAPWLITPHCRNSSEAIERTQTFIASLGAHVHFLSGEVHDRQAALISHLPYLISKAYLKFVQEKENESIAIAGPGFHSLTRLAHDNPELHKEIRERNTALIKSYGREFVRYLEKNL